MPCAIHGRSQLLETPIPHAKLPTIQFPSIVS
jgi:hypothetical protein